jgi:GT2 family glycosyltransferase
MVGRGGQTPVAAIVVNFNAGEALSRCIRSVLAQDDSSTVTVIDNASTDGSAAQAQRQFGSERRVSFLQNADNPGFATAVNRAARQLLDESPGLAVDGCLLILNPDCEMQAGSLRALRHALEADPAAALAGPLVTDEAGRPQRATLRRFPDPWVSLVTFSGLWRLEPWLPVFRGVESVSGLPLEVTRSEAVSGACMLVRTEAFLGIGGMDDAYGLHCEDLDLMYRLRKQGGYCLFVPQARVQHLQGLSSQSRPLWVHWQKHRGMQRFFLKFQAPAYVNPWRWPVSLLVLLGIWARFTVTLPLALLRR